MRVIAGKWRGRRLRVPTGREIRPTADRVKEAMFSILGTELTGSVFLDICCGAGGLAVEALSRGADQVILIDTSARALAAAEANLTACGAHPRNWRLVRGEALDWLQRWSPPVGGIDWILVADPPYGSSTVAELVGQFQILRCKPGFRMAVLEHGTTDLPAEQGNEIEVRKYGGSCLSIFRTLSSDQS